MITEDKELLALQKKLNEDAENPVDMFNLFDQAYNTGVEHCIEMIDEYFRGTNPMLTSYQIRKDLITQLEQLKKQIP